MASTIAYGRALFYPHIDFHNDKWLKTAALYYKGLNRIVPEGYIDFRESELISRLNENEDFVRNINPGWAAEDIAGDFLDFAEKELADSKYREDLINNLANKISKFASYPIHMGKMGDILRHHLPRLGLAVRERRSNWYEFEPVTGAIYMTCLANRLAEEARIPVVTDEPAFQSLIRGIQLDRYRGNRDVGEILASMVIQSVIPQDIENVSISKILKLRKDYEDERHLFYNEINKLVKDLETIDNESALKDALESRKTDVKIAVKTLDKTFKGIGIATGLTTFAILIPTFASTLGFGIAMAGPIAVAAGKLAEKGLEYYKSKTGSPYSYVLSLKKELKPETFADQLLRGKIIM